MSKYNARNLKWAARQVIKAERDGDTRAIDLYVQVAGRAAMTPTEARNRIYELAGEIDDEG